ncbi:hypothetical protein CEXT_718331 [Caerostris extrusa]|uniref:Uncharacterized protein n=1 Tax=Caerostris extrusa TaxID=172846 RepID=A0AAV4XGG2_CAEEX|nr:hypothetical protein CEXT_718331 [Caerostris extrusa]
MDLRYEPRSCIPGKATKSRTWRLKRSFIRQLPWYRFQLPALWRPPKSRPWDDEEGFESSSAGWSVRCETWPNRCAASISSSHSVYSRSRIPCRKMR